jgi:hypothetical protein
MNYNSKDDFFKYNCGSSFLINSKNIINEIPRILLSFDNSNCKIDFYLCGFLEKFDFLESNLCDEEKHVRKHDLDNLIGNHLDNFIVNFFISGSISIEFALKGLFLLKANKTKLEKYFFLSKNLIYKENYLDLENNITIKLSKLIENCDEFLPKDVVNDYKGMFEYFRGYRNPYIHFSYKNYEISSSNFIKNFKKLFCFKDEIINKYVEESIKKEKYEKDN